MLVIDKPAARVRLTTAQRRALIYVGRRVVTLQEMRVNGFNKRVINGLAVKRLAFWSSEWPGQETCALNDAGCRALDALYEEGDA